MGGTLSRRGLTVDVPRCQVLILPRVAKRNGGGGPCEAMVEGAAEVQDKFLKRRGPLHRADARSPPPSSTGEESQCSIDSPIRTSMSAPYPPPWSEAERGRGTMRSMVEGAAEVQDKFLKRRGPLHRADA